MDRREYSWNALLAGFALLSLGYSIGMYVGHLQDGADMRLIRQS